MAWHRRHRRALNWAGLAMVAALIAVAHIALAASFLYQRFLSDENPS